MFEWYGVAERHKVTVAATYLNDAGDAWYQGWSKVREERRWEEFAEELCERFGDRGLSDVVDEFNKLKQVGTVLDYQLRFEELKALMLNHNPYLTEAYFVSCFLKWLERGAKANVEGASS